ncbi:hypothetical protein E2C01_097423 [Portunus trituberculatus]|uniref:Uncharacterized protein n=1 Tax=Portunus trituberculatus TaxID=210409 RepID=A0A5B7KB77_PORTR|nr:hypothetical protein [Portunus trituberculatus]
MYGKVARRYVVGFHFTRGRLPDPMLTTLSTMTPPPIKLKYGIGVKEGKEKGWKELCLVGIRL